MGLNSREKGDQKNEPSPLNRTILGRAKYISSLPVLNSENEVSKVKYDTKIRKATWPIAIRNKPKINRLADKSLNRESLIYIRERDNILWPKISRDPSMINIYTKNIPNIKSDSLNYSRGYECNTHIGGTLLDIESKSVVDNHSNHPETGAKIKVRDEVNHNFGGAIDWVARGANNSEAECYSEDEFYSKTIISPEELANYISKTPETLVDIIACEELVVRGVTKACETLCSSSTAITIPLDDGGVPTVPPQGLPSFTPLLTPLISVLPEKGDTVILPPRASLAMEDHVQFKTLQEMTQTKSGGVMEGVGGGGVAALSSGSGEGSSMDTRRALLCLAAIFLISLASLTFVYKNFPQLEEEEYVHMKLPSDIEDAKNLGRVLSLYKDRYYTEVLLAIFVIYIFLQTFAVPGSIFLSILSGFLFRWEVALMVICFCSATGATFCYLLSYLAGRPIVLKYLPERTQAWQQKVEKQGDNLLFYIIFLRITPFLPNWFINITSPVINVPIFPFWLGTFLGVGPPSILAVQAGTTLYQLTSSRDAFSFTSIVLLGLAALLSLVPIILKNRLREKFD